MIDNYDFWLMNDREFERQERVERQREIDEELADEYEEEE